MYLLIYNSTKPKGMPGHPFVELDVQEHYRKADVSDYLYRTNSEEYLADQIAAYVDQEEYRGVKAVIIDKHLGGDGWARAIRLAGHIALTAYVNCPLNKLPIILTDGALLDIKDGSLAETAITYPFETGGFHFKTYTDLFNPQFNPISGKEEFPFQQETLENVAPNKWHVTGPQDSRHQSTNEWGAMRLARHFGLRDQIDFNYPKHLYFKYLILSLEDGNIPQDKDLFGLFHKILLVDDQAGLGWLELMKKVFGCQVDTLVPKSTDQHWQAVDFSQYDLVLLDLYLEGKPDKTLSLAVLKHIKERHPHIPVVIFTASDKAWNLDEVIDRGADGMYIKESPAHVKDEQYSRENFKDFKHTVRAVHDKYKVLRPYWEAIGSVLANRNFQSIETNPRKFKDRMEERLKMFYGLLKKGYEQSSYDISNFFYSDYELAFMTLWSALNEIQEYSFLKTQSRTREQWQLQLDGSNYLTYNTRKHRTSFHTALLALPHWVGKSSADQKLRSFKQTISLQITFIVERMNPSNKAALLTDLTRLNQTRNKLYLTHGDNIDPNFFALTEEDKRASTTITPQGEIKDLFNIVCYLLTADETIKI